MTEEHVPPKSIGNRGPVKLEAVELNSEGQTFATRNDGVALRVLCERCNMNYGSRLGTGFSNFAKQFQNSGELASPRGGVISGATDVFPSRVLRHLYLNYLCVQVTSDRTEWEAIRQFIKSREGRVPPEAPRVSLYFNASTTYRVVPVCAVGAIDGSRRRWYGSEIAAPGLGVLFTLPDTQSAESLIGLKPVDITEWCEYRFDQRDSVALSLPRVRVEHPHPIGFGRSTDVEGWRDRNMIVWGVARAEDPSAINSTAVLWQPVKKRR